jgi:hypothetical protein
MEVVKLEENKALSILNYQGSPLQTIAIEGEIWWVASDVCKVLEHSDVSKAVSRLDEDEKLVRTVFVSGQHRNVLCVNESGLYHLIFTSRKKEAQAFRKWVTSEVLPSIRKTGKYVVPKQLRLPGTRKLYLPERGYHISSSRIEITADEERKLLIEYVQHTWELYGSGITANTLANSFVRRFSTAQALQRLEEAAHAGQLEHFYTPHTRRSGGKFRPVRNNDNIA